MEYQISHSQFEYEAKNLFQNLFEDENFTDVTIVCGDGKQFRAHKVILSSCSLLFRNILINNPHQNPLLYFHDIGDKAMEALVKFIYTGETKVAQESLDDLLETAKKLQINGLSNHEIVLKEKYVLNEHIGKESESIHHENMLNIQGQVGVQNKQLIKKEDETMKQDEYTTESDKSNRKYPCDSCQYKSTTSSNLRTHQRLKHGNVFLTKPEKHTTGKYSCDKCDYKATQSGNVRVHQRMKHEGIKFPCSLCSHESGSAGNLMSHVKRRHTGK